MARLKNEVKKALKELGYTAKDMQQFWDECVEVNWKVKYLSNIGKNWTDLSISQIKQLPTLKETTLESQRKKQEEEEVKRMEEQKVADEKKYYEEHFEEIIVQKINNGEKLTESEIKECIWDYPRVELIEGDSGRWTQYMESIIELCGRTFCFPWDRGLTEYQENGFYYQPYEVEKHEYEKTITVTEWRRVNEK